MRSQDGFTLIELLVAMTIGLIVAAGAMTLSVAATRSSDDVARRNEAAQQARTALDYTTRLLRSQVCLPTATAPLPPLVAATPSSATFYADVTDQRPAAGATVPTFEKHTLTLDAAAKRLTDVVQTSAGQPPSFAAAASRTRTVATDVTTGSVGSPATAVPTFRYYAFTDATPPTATTELVPAAAGLSAADLQRVARVAVTVQGDPAGRQTGTRRTTLTDDVFVRLTSADGIPTPACS